MNPTRLAVLVSLAALFACTVESNPDDSGFYGCETADDCLTGFTCYFGRCHKSAEASAVDACSRFQESFAALDCVAGSVDFSCDNYAELGCDMVPYFECLSGAYVCGDSGLDNTGLAECGPPACLADTNFDACVALEEHFNGLPCVGTNIDFGCDTTRGEMCNTAPFNACLVANYVCSGSVIDVSGVQACIDSAPACWPTSVASNADACNDLETSLEDLTCTPGSLDFGCDLYGSASTDCADYFACVSTGVSCSTGTVDSSLASTCWSSDSCDWPIDLDQLVPPVPIGVCSEYCINNADCNDGLHCLGGKCMDALTCAAASDCVGLNPLDTCNFALHPDPNLGRCTTPNCVDDNECTTTYFGFYNFCSNAAAPDSYCMECTTAADCGTDTGCNDGFCVGCETPSHCTPDWPACINGACGCGDHVQCVESGTGLTQCIFETGLCGCFGDDDCITAGLGNFCDLDSGQCQCGDESECTQVNLGTTVSCQ